MKTLKAIFTLAVLVSIFSCASHSYSPEAAYAYMPADVVAYKTTAGMSEERVHSGYEDRSAVRMVLYNAWLTVVVKDTELAAQKLQEVAKKYNGYVNQTGTYSTIIRVKSDKLDDAVAEIEALGKVQSKSISGQDVTDEYFDYQIRLENAEKARTRYLELLEKAENVEAALKVEKELERLNTTIDQLNGKINRLNHLAEFSTITITLKEKKKPGVLGYVGLGLYHSVKWLFVRN